MQRDLRGRILFVMIDSPAVRVFAQSQRLRQAACRRHVGLTEWLGAVSERSIVMQGADSPGQNGNDKLNCRRWAIRRVVEEPVLKPELPDSVSHRAHRRGHPRPELMNHRIHSAPTVFPERNVFELHLLSTSEREAAGYVSEIRCKVKPAPFRGDHKIASQSKRNGTVAFAIHANRGVGEAEHSRSPTNDMSGPTRYPGACPLDGSQELRAPPHTDHEPRQIISEVFPPFVTFGMIRPLFI